MSEVKRYGYDSILGMIEAENGVKPEWIKASDYEALQQKMGAVVAENAVIKSGVADITFMKDDDFFGSTSEAQRVMGHLVNIQTPATDAILNAVRAEGVRHVRKQMIECPFEDIGTAIDYCDEFIESVTDATKGGSDDK